MELVLWGRLPDELAQDPVREQVGEGCQNERTDSAKEHEYGGEQNWELATETITHAVLGMPRRSASATHSFSSAVEVRVPWHLRPVALQPLRLDRLVLCRQLLLGDLKLPI